MTRALVIEPLDLLTSSADAGLLHPETLTGALRAHLLRGAGADREQGLARAATLRVRGPLYWDLAKQSPFIPCPADLVCAVAIDERPSRKARLLRLAPLAAELPGYAAPEGLPQARPLWFCGPDLRNARAEDACRLRRWQRVDGFLAWPAFLAWAEGRTPVAADCRSPSQVWSLERRPDRARDREYLRLARGIALYCEIEGAGNFLRKPFSFTLGGERRVAEARPVDPVVWPKPGQGRLVALALTPVEGAGVAQWSPIARGHATTGLMALGGWDLAGRRPKPARWALRPGSVWHLDAPGDFAAPTTIPASDEVGHGWLAWGRWDHAEDAR